MNLNAAPTESVGLVGYLPELTVPESLKHGEKYKACTHYLFQRCIGHILQQIEDRALRGFVAVVDGHKRVLFPRLGALTLDTKERVKYFGLRSDRACGFCRLRHGRSLARKGSRQDAELLNLLHSWASVSGNPANGVHLNQVQISQRAKARAKLRRHGWAYKRKCMLHDYADRCLVHIPRFGNVPYAGLAHFERLHVFFLNYCTYCMEKLSALVINPTLVYQRVQACHQFRDPHTGKTHPRLPSLIKMTHYTAERRVRAIFYWAHVLGTKAEVVVTEMRTHAQVAVSTLQLLLIATRGHRAYSENELNTIFGDVGTHFFRSLAAMNQYIDSQRMKNGAIAHARQPSRVRQPLPYKRPNRCVFIHLACEVTHVACVFFHLACEDTNVACVFFHLACEVTNVACVSHNNRDEDESATESTDEELTWGGLGKLEYGKAVLPHALIHTSELVIRGGHHAAFCTFAVETAHKHFIKLAATFARVYADTNRSQREMMKWVNETQLWDAISRVADLHNDKKPSHRPKQQPSLRPMNVLSACSRAWGRSSTNRRQRLPASWYNQFVHPRVRLTRMELLRILCVKLGVEDSYASHRLLVQNVKWEFFGSLQITSDSGSRKFVGVMQGRRDFVRIKGPPEDSTCLSAQLLVFVKITGLQDFMTLPSCLRNHIDDVTAVTLTLIRWLSPHPDAILRDDQLRPTCPPPLDINHALWKFTETTRPNLTDAIVMSNSSCYPDANTIINEKTARFDLVQPESLHLYLNCTQLDRNDVLETITLPFTN